MSAWAWRDCGKCKSPVHYNSICKCGGDPFGVRDRAKDDLKEVNYKISLLTNQLRHNENEKVRLEKIINENKTLKI